MKRSYLLLFQVALLLTVACSKEAEQNTPPVKESAPAASSPSAAPGKGTIVGKVIFTGIQRGGKLPVGKDREVCGEGKQDPSLIVAGDGGVQNAVVQVTGLRGGAMPNKEVVVDQNKCEYQPHVSVVSTGTTVIFKNSDGILHNIHSVSQLNAPFNRAQPKYLKEIKETFATAEVIALRCDVHGWMSGWIVVTDNGFFAVTESDGSFSLGGVPAGKHNLAIWHEKLGSLTQTVELRAGESVNVSFEFQAKK